VLSADVKIDVERKELRAGIFTIGKRK